MFAFLAKISILILLVQKCTSFSKANMASISIIPNHRLHNQLGMQQSNFEDEEKQSITDIITSPGISIGAGVAGIFVLLANRLSFGDIVSDVQSRADIISVIACSALLLNVLSEQDIQARNRDPVPLVGYALKNPLIREEQSSTVVSAIEWCINTILKTTPATSVHIISDSNFMGKGGVVGMGDDRTSFAVKNIDKMPILQKALKLSEEVYLPDLQVGVDSDGDKISVTNDDGDDNVKILLIIVVLMIVLIMP
jgi:hypothetical protein